MMLKEIWDSYGNMWKKAFDFKGYSDRSEFLEADAVNFVIFGFVNALALIFPLLFLYDLLVIVPWLALEVRRLRDGGFSWVFVLLNLLGLGLLFDTNDVFQLVFLLGILVPFFMCAIRKSVPPVIKKSKKDDLKEKDSVHNEDSI